VVFNEFINGLSSTSGGRIQRKACLKAPLLELKEQPGTLWGIAMGLCYGYRYVN
jgi:hypothetical protein